MRSLIPCAVALSLIAAGAHAEEAKSTIIEVYKSAANGKTRSQVAGLVNMDVVMNSPQDRCTQMIGKITVEGIQFSRSGTILESFHFRDQKGNVFSVPTNIGNLSNAARGHANSFIKQGKTYFAHIQLCGSGGYPSLINLYDPTISMGAFE